VFPCSTVGSFVNRTLRVHGCPLASGGVDLVDYKMALVPPARKAAEQQEVQLEAAAAALIADYVSRLRDSRSSEKYRVTRCNGSPSNRR
jgi:RecB family exonuclease